MVLSLRPLTARVLRRGLSGETVVLSPSVKRYRPAAIALPGEVERAEAFHNLDPAKVTRHLGEGEDIHPATTATLVRDAIVADGCVYAGGLSVITQEKRRAVLRGAVTHFDEAQLCTTHCGSLYFGDWLMVDLPLESLARQRGIAPLSSANLTFDHESGYRSLLGLPRRERPSIAHVDRLWIIEDNGMTTNRLARYDDLRSRVRPPPSRPRRIFIGRGEWGAERDITNREQVIHELGRWGFEAIQPERMSVAELRQVLSGAEICVGVEGSALAHAILMMPEGGCLLSLTPSRRFVDSLKWFTDAVGLRYAYMVFDQSVDIGRLHATIDLIKASTPRRDSGGSCLGLAFPSFRGSSAMLQSGQGSG